MLAILFAAATAARSAAAVAAAPAAAVAAAAPSPLGLWQTISDVDGKPKALVRISEVGDELRGVIEYVEDPSKRQARCVRCPSDRHDQPILGLTIIQGMHRQGDHYAGGQILDPDSGYLYACRLTLAPGGQRLEVRGYLGFALFGRSQTWIRRQ